MAPGLNDGPRRGEIWHYSFKRPDKRRPVVVLTREEVLPLLHTAMVAPVTSTIRGLPSEVIVGVDEGLRHDSAINLDHVQTVEKTAAVAPLRRVAKPGEDAAGLPGAGRSRRLRLVRAAGC